MRPSRYATYWDTSVRTQLPCLHPITRVSGRSVVSTRKDLPPTLPFKIADRRLLIGKSGFVTSVEFETGGARRSTCLILGATGSLFNPAAARWRAVGWGIRAAPPLVHSRSVATAVDSRFPVAPPASPTKTARTVPIEIA